MNGGGVREEGRARKNVREGERKGGREDFERWRKGEKEGGGKMLRENEGGREEEKGGKIVIERWRDYWREGRHGGKSVREEGKRGKMLLEGEKGRREGGRNGMEGKM